MAIKNKVYAALDIGSTKITFVIGIQKESGLEIIGAGKSLHPGTRQGFVTNIQSATESILTAKREAVKSAGMDIDHAWLGVNGTHIQSVPSYGMGVVENGIVSRDDVKRVVQVAQALPLPSDRIILHAIPKSFKLDNREEISDPVGMIGSRLESPVHLITASRIALENIINCCDRANLSVDGIIYQPLAAAECLLSKEEMLSGVTLIDLGGASCDILTFSAGVAVQVDVIPVGGAHFTRDLAIGLKITLDQAEALKIKYGRAISNIESASSEEIFIDSLGEAGKSINSEKLCQILEARSEETLLLISDKISKSISDSRPRTGIVFTGGAVQLKVMLELARMIFDEPVYLGNPKNIKDFSEMGHCVEFSSSVGAIMYASKKNNYYFNFTGKEIMGDKLSFAKDQVKKYFENLF